MKQTMRKYFFLPVLLHFLLLAVGANAQDINTVAGDGGGNYTGDKGPARAAELHWPKGVCFDRMGNLFVADYDNNVIRKVDVNGIITTVAGSGFGAGTEEGNFSGDGGQATAAHLWAPSGVCVDTNEFIYIADLANHRVRMVDTNGIITTIAGTGLPGYSGDGGAATAAQLNEPAKVVMDTFGNLFIVDMMNNCIRAMNPSGVIITVAGNGTMAYGYSGDGGPSTAAQLNNPADVAVDYNDNLYIADQVNNVIRYVDGSTGTITTLAGAGSAGFRGDGGNATTCQFFDPSGIAVDTSGNVYVSDRSNNRIRKINMPTGIITTVAGDGPAGYVGDGGPATAAELSAPEGLFTDWKGGVYIADKGNNVIRYLGVHASGVPAVTSGTCNIQVYPNPNAGDFALYIAPGLDVQAIVSITNVLGQDLKTFPTNGNTLLDVSHIGPPGIYVIAVTTAGGTWNKEVEVNR